MDMERLAEIFETVKVLPLRPDDYLLFRTKTQLSDEGIKRLRESLEAAFGGRKVIILIGDMDIEIVRPEKV